MVLYNNIYIVEIRAFSCSNFINIVPQPIFLKYEWYFTQSEPHRLRAVCSITLPLPTGRQLCDFRGGHIKRIARGAAAGDRVMCVPGANTPKRTEFYWFSHRMLAIASHAHTKKQKDFATSIHCGKMRTFMVVLSLRPEKFAAHVLFE